MNIENCRRRRRSRLLVEALEIRSMLSTAGTLDSTFGNGSGYSAIPLGVPQNPAGLNSAEVGGVVVQPDGKIVEGGTVTIGTAASLVLTRFNTNGAVDTTFGAGGTVVVPIPGLDAGSASVLFLPGGKLVEAASVNSASTTSSSYVVIRVNPDGTLDSTFGNQGVAEYPDIFGGGAPASPFGNQDVTVHLGSIRGGRGGHIPFVTRQNPGTIILTGTANDGTEFAAVRINLDGSIDTTYGTNGIALVPISINGHSMVEVSGAVMQDGDSLILEGDAVTGSHQTQAGIQNDSDVVVVRLNADGTLDTSYGGPAAVGGIVLLPPDPTRPTALGTNLGGPAALQADGKVLVTAFDDGAGNPAFSGTALYRLNTDGTLDTSFGTNGRVTVGLTPSSDLAVAAQADGKIDVGGLKAFGALGSGTLDRSGLYQLNANGSLDTTFGNSATPGLSTSLASLVAQPLALAIQPVTGDILVGGTGSTPSKSGPIGGFAVASVLSSASTGPIARPSPVPPANYDASHQTNLAVYLPSLGKFAYRPTDSFDQPDTFVPFGIPGPGQTIPAAGDYSGLGVTEIAAYLPTYGVYAIRPSIGGPDQLIPFGIPGPGQSIPAPGDYERTGKDDIAVYMPALGAFGIRPSSGGADQIVPFGIPGPGQTIPAPGDYLGTGQDDIAAYLPALGDFAIHNPFTGTDSIIPFGIPGAGQTIPAPGDYDGSGRTEMAAYLPALGLFAYRPANGGADVIVPFGVPGDGTIPAPGDYDGVGHTEIAIYDPTYGFFAYRPAGRSADVIVPFGAAGVGQSLPSATQPGALSAGLPTSSPSVNAMAFESGASSPGASGVVRSATVASGSVVPGGPVRAVRRVALAPVAQALTNPRKFDN